MTQIHEGIDPPRGINNIQSKNQNVGRTKNFRGKYKDTKCPENIETQEHVLETCPGIHTDPSTKITTNEIIENDTNKLKTTSTKIRKNQKKYKYIKKKCTPPPPPTGRAIWRSIYTHVA